MSTFAGLPLLSSAKQQPDAGKWLIHGQQGTGKTTLASTIAAVGPTLFIDLVGERGGLSFRGTPYEKNIHTVRPTTITDFDKLFYSLQGEGHPFKAVIVDSLTALQKMAMRYIMGHSETAAREIAGGSAPATLQMWGESLNIMTDTATFWNSLADGDRPNPLHVVMTAQTVMVDNEFIGTTSRDPDVQKGAKGITLAAPDYVVYTDLEQDPDADGDDGPVYRHIVRFGANPEYRTKARIPKHLRGKLPSVLGRKTDPDLAQLARILGHGGAQAPAPAKTTAAPAAAKK